jgi:pyrroloquinoline quinone biosynthesis protein B
MRRATGSVVAVAVAAVAATAIAMTGGCAAREEGGAPQESSEPTELPATAPYVVVLGTAQDGGLPHLGCDRDCCARARRDPAARRLVTSLLLCDPRDGRRWLFDCTPDVRPQMELARGHPATRKAPEGGGRPPLIDGLFLTHAHMGHYGGLLEFGREAYAVKALPTWVTPRFADFLRANGPWKLLVDEGRIDLRPFEPDAAVELAPGLSVRCFRVPHRDEYSDTVGFVIEGPSRRLLYLPDIDKWEAFDAWTPPAAGDRNGGIRTIEAAIAAVDIALIDGCFFADGEIAGRSMKEIPHPFIAESIARFAPLPATEREKIFFTHLNHTNAAAVEEGHAWRSVIAAGMHVLSDGRVFGL